MFVDFHCQCIFNIFQLAHPFFDFLRGYAAGLNLVKDVFFRLPDLGQFFLILQNLSFQGFQLFKVGDCVPRGLFDCWKIAHHSENVLDNGIFDDVRCDIFDPGAVIVPVSIAEMAII